MLWELSQFIIDCFRLKKRRVPTVVFIVLILSPIVIYLVGQHYANKSTDAYQQKQEEVQKVHEQLMQSPIPSLSPKQTNGSNEMSDTQEDRARENSYSEIGGFRSLKTNFQKAMIKENYNSALIAQLLARVEDNIRRDKLERSDLEEAIRESLPSEASDAEVEKVRLLIIESTPKSID